MDDGSMRCWFCRGIMYWNGDNTFEDFDLYGDGIVATLTCSDCGATAEFYTKAEEE